MEQGTQIERAGVGAGMTATQGATGVAITKTGETSAMVLAEQAKAGVLARFYQARMVPREAETARVRILKDCERPRFAELATYEIPRGGKTITGPSIRLAEVCVRAWGNIEIDAVITYEDDEKRHVRVTATDFETNATYSTDVTVSKVVERREVRDKSEIVGQRVNSQGIPVYIVRANETDLLAKHNALVSKARRNVIFAIVPGDLVEEAQERAAETVAKRDAQDPDAERRRIFDSFARLSVEPAQLAEALGTTTAAIGPAQITQLRKWYAAIRDGEMTIADLIALGKPKPPAADEAANGSSATSKAKAAARGVAAASGAKPADADAKAKERAEAIARGEDPDA
jgi:hypothetical protein